MTPLLKTTAATVSAVVLAVLLFPVAAQAQAQGRVAVPRPVPARPIRGGGAHHAPAVYRSYYASPYWYGAYYPGYYPGYYPFSFSVGFGCCGYPYYGYPYYPYGYYPYDISASLRLQVTPREAEVFVDGYYAGTVDDFDGTFQRLHAEPGDHDLEVFMPGHRSYQQKVYLQPGKTFNVRHAMEPLGAGEAEPARPVGKPRPAPPARSPERQPPIDPRDQDPSADPGQGPERAPRSEFGSLAIRVQPGDANVTIDGEPWESTGQNERLIVQLGPGIHSVQIRKDGYRTYLTDITVRPGETTTLNVAMTPNR